MVLAFANFLLLVGFALTVFRVPFTGSFPTYAAAALLYVTATTGIGLVISSFMKSQIAALFGTVLITLIPAIQYSGLIDPVSSLQGVGKLIGLDLSDQLFRDHLARHPSRRHWDSTRFTTSSWRSPSMIPVLVTAGALLLKKQAR